MNTSTSELNEVEKCFLCSRDLNIENKCIVEVENLQNFIKFSKIRRDNFHKRWEKLEKDTFHAECQTTYLLSRKIVAKLNDDTTSTHKRPSSDSEEASSLHSEFDFHHNCFICGTECNEDKEMRKPERKRRKISRVVDDVTARIRAAADAIDDELGFHVKERVPENVSLNEKGAVYHNFCWNNFLGRMKRRRESVGRPVEVEKFEKFEAICKELETTHKTQILFDELYAKIGTDCVHRKKFKEKLQERFGDKLIFSSRGGAKTVITLSKHLHEILLHNYYFDSMTESEKQRTECIKKCAKIIRHDICEKNYENSVYPSVNNFFHDVDNDVPSSVKKFLNYVIRGENYIIRPVDAKVSSEVCADNLENIESQETSGFPKEYCPDEEYEEIGNQETSGFPEEYCPDEEYEEIENPEVAIEDTVIDVTDDTTSNNRIKKQVHREKQLDTKIVSLSHALIRCVRPRSFTSPILLGTSIYIHTKYASKQLIHLLSNMGFCASYQDTRLFEASSIMTSPVAIVSSSAKSIECRQFIFDNADHNAATYDGTGSLHLLGGLKVTTPGKNVPSLPPITKLKKMPKAEEIEERGKINIITLNQDIINDSINIPLQDVYGLPIIPQHILRCPSHTYLPQSDVILPKSEVLWLAGVTLKIKNHPSWHGFMEKRTRMEPFDASHIKFLSFIDLPASSPDALYTALKLAKSEAEKDNVGTVCVTFDQPLYWKSRNIVASDESNFKSIVIVLGSFHLLMSYMGAIGFIMKDTGLQEVFATVYAFNSTKEMLTGHSYARAVRAHFLTQTALLSIVIDELSLTAEERREMEIILTANAASDSIENMAKHDVIEKFKKKIENQLQIISKRGKTAKLWVQYIRMVSLIKSLINAERSTNWELHLSTIKEMLPFFHSGGRFQYVKSAHLYLQDMLSLREKMIENSKELYSKKLEELKEKFVDENIEQFLREERALRDKFGDAFDKEFVQYTNSFAIRRTVKFWSAVPSDQTIEQTMMRLFGCTGGPKHARGITPSVRTSWILSMPFCIEVILGLEKFTGMESTSNEQHEDLKDGNINRFIKDLSKFREWFENHNPFPESEFIISLSCGVIGQENVNCYSADEVGLNFYIKMLENNNNFKDISISHNKVVPLSNMLPQMKIKKKVEPTRVCLLQRMLRLNPSTEELQSFFQYELSPYPQSLFEGIGMLRTSSKSFFDQMKCYQAEVSAINFTYVIDGEYLLRKVSWDGCMSYGDAYKAHIQFIDTFFQRKTIIFFPNHCKPDADPITADMFRKMLLPKSNSILFNEDTKLIHTKDKLLSNYNNKCLFIQQLVSALERENIQVQYLQPALFDVCIVKAAINISRLEEPICLISENPDLLVLLLHYVDVNSCNNIYFLKPAVKNSKKLCLSVAQIVESYLSSAVVKELLLPIYAFTGSRITSFIAHHTKTSAMNKIIGEITRNMGHLIHFLTPGAYETDISNAGKALFTRIYNITNDKSLSENRYNVFTRAISQKNRKKEVSLDSLPPTDDAATYHSKRVYFQVQLWLQNHEVQASELGWCKNGTGKFLQPIGSTQPMAADELLKLTSCACAGDCNNNRCSCHKNNLKCSFACKNCLGEMCLNTSINRPTYDGDSDNEDIIETEKQKEIEEAKNDEENEKNDNEEDIIEL